MFKLARSLYCPFGNAVVTAFIARVETAPIVLTNAPEPVPAPTGITKSDDVLL